MSVSFSTGDISDILLAEISNHCISESALKGFMLLILLLPKLNMLSSLRVAKLSIFSIPLP